MATTTAHHEQKPREPPVLVGMLKQEPRRLTGGCVWSSLRVKNSSGPDLSHSPPSFMGFNLQELRQALSDNRRRILSHVAKGREGVSNLKYN